MPKKRKYLIPDNQRTFNQMLRNPRSESAKQSAARKQAVRAMDRLQTLLDKTEQSWAGKQASKALSKISDTRLAGSLQEGFDKFEDSELAKGIQSRLNKLDALVRNSYLNKLTHTYEVSADELSEAATEARSAYSNELAELTKSNQRAAREARKNRRITENFEKQINLWSTDTMGDEIEFYADYYFNTDFGADAEQAHKAKVVYDYAVTRMTRQSDVMIFYHQTQEIWQGQDPAKRNQLIVDYLSRWGARLDSGKRVANLEDAWNWFHEKHEPVGDKLFTPTQPQLYSNNERYWKLLYAPKDTWSDSDDAFMDDYAEVVPYDYSVRL